MSDNKISLSIQVEDSFCKFLNAKIKGFNDLISHHHKAARKPEAIKPLNIMLKSDSEVLLGGLSARTYWDWLEVDDFYLPSELRGQGLGGRILRMAEATAMERGCTKSHLSTFSFQAPAFYQSHGYVIVGRLEDYPPGSTFYWLRKNLSLPLTRIIDHQSV